MWIMERYKHLKSCLFMVYYIHSVGPTIDYKEILELSSVTNRHASLSKMQQVWVDNIARKSDLLSCPFASPNKSRPSPLKNRVPPSCVYVRNIRPASKKHDCRQCRIFKSRNEMWKKNYSVRITGDGKDGFISETTLVPLLLSVGTFQSFFLVSFLIDLMHDVTPTSS